MMRDLMMRAACLCLALLAGCADGYVSPWESARTAYREQCDGVARKAREGGNWQDGLAGMDRAAEAARAAGRAYPGEIQIPSEACANELARRGILKPQPGGCVTADGSAACGR